MKLWNKIVMLGVLALMSKVAQATPMAPLPDAELLTFSIIMITPTVTVHEDDSQRRDWVHQIIIATLPPIDFTLTDMDSPAGSADQLRGLQRPDEDEDGEVPIIPPGQPGTAFVPIPSSIVLFVLGLVGLGIHRRKCTAKF